MKKLFKLMISSFIISSLLLNTVNVFAQGQVRVSVGNKIASVNGENVTLDVAPYIQKPSESMMIPLRFVSTGLGIDENNIQFIPNTKEIIIKNNDTTIKFIAGSSKMSINEEIFDMGMKDSKTGKIDYIYTEIKNGSTFIPLRALETGLGIKIDWESSTKTAILTNENSNEPVLQGDINEDVKESNSNTSNTELTEQDIRAMEEEVVRLVNEERAKYGLQPLEISEKLMKTARAKSEDMIRDNYYAHINSNGYAMYKYLNVGENIYSNEISPKSAVNSWLSSTKGHREQILNPNYKYIGVGLGINSYNKSSWTQHFSSENKWAN